jgi:hypothetical protein
MTTPQYPNLISLEHGFADWPDYPNGYPRAYAVNRLGQRYELPCQHTRRGWMVDDGEDYYGCLDCEEMLPEPEYDELEDEMEVKF